MYITTRPKLLKFPFQQTRHRVMTLIPDIYNGHKKMGKIMLINKLSALCRAVGVWRPAITKQPFLYNNQLQGSRLNTSTCLSYMGPTSKLLPTSNPAPSLNTIFGQSVRNYFVFNNGIMSNFSKLLLPAVSNYNLQQVRTYKVKVKLKRRCKGCYFEKRLGRWYVECTLKPRHKQMQKIHRKYLYREDYSKGNIRLAAYWGWRKQRFYWKGDQIEKDFYKPLIDYKTTTVTSPH